MRRCAKEGTCLAELVKAAIPVCLQAERECPRTGPGRKPEIADWVMTMLIMVAVMKRRKSKSSQYRFLDKHRWQLMEWLGVERFPSRTTYFDRYRRAHELYEHAIRIEGSRAVAHGLADARCLAVDQSVIRARGPRWNKQHVKRKKVPRGADLEATWTYSEYHGWVLGYSYEVVVTAGKNGTVWPLLASADPAKAHPARTFPSKIAQLPKTVRHVLADSAYDTNAIGEAIEYDSNDRRTGRRYLCPQIYRGGEQRRPKQPRVERGSRRIRRERRDERRRYFESPRAKRLFARRGQSVEPFNQWLKSAFEFGDRVWHKGLQNNQTQLLAAIFCYQMLLRYNRKHGRKNGQIQWILDQL